MAAPNRRGLRWAPFVIATFIVFVAPASTNASTVSADELDVSTISGLSGQDWVAVSTTLFFPNDGGSIVMHASNAPVHTFPQLYWENGSLFVMQLDSMTLDVFSHDLLSSATVSVSTAGIYNSAGIVSLGPILSLSSITAAAFIGDGFNLGNLSSAAVNANLYRSSVTASAFFGDGFNLGNLSSAAVNANLYRSSVTASAFFGDGFNLGNLSSVAVNANLYRSSVTASAFFGDGFNLGNLSSAAVNANLYQSSVTASAFFGDGFNLGNLSSAAVNANLYQSSVTASAFFGTFFGDGSHLNGLARASSTTVRGLYVHQASPASLAVVWSDGISSTTYVSSGSLAIQAVVDTGKARVDIVEVDPFGVVYVTTGAESTYTPETAGISISSVSPATDIAAGTMMVDINGEGAQEISIGPDADGPSIAADIRAKVSTISASPEYANFTAVFTDDGRYLLTSGTSGYGSSVTVTNATGSITWNPFESFPSTGQLSIQEDKYWTWYFYNPGSLSHWQVSAANGLDIQLPTYSNCAVKTQSPGINSGSWRFELKTGSAASQGVGENVVILFYGTSDWQDEGYNVKVQGYGLFYDINADAVELGRFGTPSEASDTPSQVAYCGSIPRGPSFHDWIITKNGQGNFACWLDGVKKSTGSDTTFNTATAMFGVRGYNASGDASSYFYLTDIQYSSDVYGEGGGGLAAMLKLGLSNGGTETPGADASGTPPLIPAPTAGRYKLANVCSPMAPIMPVTTAVRNGDIWEDPTYR